MVAAGNLIVDGLTDNRVVLRWCHRSVALVASRRYRREIDDIKAAHHDISCLFLETWLNGKLLPPPLTLAVGAVISDQPTTGVGVAQRNESVCAIVPLAVDRHIAAQPLLFSETAYNFRRLSELWYQLLNAGKFIAFCIFIKAERR